MNAHRLAKNEQLTRLASEITTGIIVELGAYRGEGTAALCRGATVEVWAIDDYKLKRGWAGEIYREDNLEICRANLKHFLGWRAYIIVGEVSRVAREWWKYKEAISLLVWDLGISGRLQQDFDDWQDRVVGKFVIHDTDDQRLGSRELNPAGWTKYKEGVFWILERQ